jgi:hypothetical protein
MKKHILRAFVATFSFGISLGFVYLLSVNYQPEYFEFTNYSSNEETFEIHNKKKNSNKVELNFLEFTEINDAIYAKFEIVNNTSEEITYSSYNNGDDSDEISNTYAIKVGGKDVSLAWCGTGLMPYQLKSGESKIFTAYLNQITEHWKKGKSIQVGFYYNKPLENKYLTVWSENLPINSEIESKLLEIKRESEK